MTTDITVTSNTFSTNRRANIGTNSHQPATSNPTATASATTKATVAATLLKHQQKSDDTDVGLRPVTDAGKGSGDLIAQSADLHAELNEVSSVTALPRSWNDFSYRVYLLSSLKSNNSRGRSKDGRTR